MTKKIVGKISHYFDKIGVAVIEVENTIKKGDKLVFEGAGGEFKQEADSMQIDRKEIEVAKKGQSIGIKTEEEVRPGWKVYRDE